MSHYEYEFSKLLSVSDPPFVSIIMAGIRKADDASLEKIKKEWPEIFEEFVARYNAPGGYLPEEIEKMEAESNRRSE